MLNIRGVSKSFGENGRRVQALSPVDLTVQEGQFVSFVGPSGCGKSTLLNIVAGLDSYDTGSVMLEDRAVSAPGSDRVVVFQEAALFPWLSAQQNVEFGLKMAGMPKSERITVARTYLRMVHLSRFADSYPHELSGGMRQRVAIARALAMSPRILLMDEPFAALDSQTRALLHEEVMNIWSLTGTTVIFVTHNVREAVYLSDRILIFSARPGSIKDEFRVPRGRPRDLSEPSLAFIEKQITESLQVEIEKVAQSELDSDWVHEKNRLLPSPDSVLGGGI